MNKAVQEAQDLAAKFCGNVNLVDDLLNTRRQESLNEGLIEDAKDNE